MFKVYNPTDQLIDRWTKGKYYQIPAGGSVDIKEERIAKDLASKHPALVLTTDRVNADKSSVDARVDIRPKKKRFNLFRRKK